MLKYSLVINIAISIFMFGFIFYSYAGESGGDIAIVMFNIFFGLFQIIVVGIVGKIYKIKTNGKVIAAICIIQLIELLIFIEWGYAINEWIKKI